MFSSTRLRKYPLAVFIFSICLIGVLLINYNSATSQISVTASSINNSNIQVAKETDKYSVIGNVRKTVLENGLTVLTKEVHSAPVVTVQAWYKVGSLNEAPGVNGIAHQLEHMLFKGTKDRPIQFGRLFSALGSDSNAFTSYDQTAYYNTAERDKLNALLILEADRMQNALIDAEQLASEKRVVISELQGYENSPDYRLSKAVLRAVYPQHPYGLPVGGTQADVEKFQISQVQEYYRNFYTPDQAVLVIVGDFDTAKTLTAVREIFGGIKRAEGSRQKAEGRKNILASNASNSPIVLREPGASAFVQVVYPLPDVNHPDVPALNVMDYILTQGRNSRLYLDLVESGLATDLSGEIINLREAGWYELSVTASNRQKLSKIDTLLKKAIANLSNKGVSPEEVKLAKAQLEAGVILDSRDITSQAMQLGDDETTAGDYRYTEKYLAAIRQVTPQDVQRVANKYLAPKLGVVGLFEPNKIQVSTENTSKPHTAKLSETFSSGTLQSSEEIAKYLPTVDGNVAITTRLPQQFTLSNGLRLLLLPDKSTPTVTLSGNIKAGSEFDPDNKAGLASVVAENLMNGTKTRNVYTLAKILDERGASLGFETYREGVEIQGDALAKDLPILVQVLADVVQNPIFPKQELELIRQQALSDLEEELDDPAEVAKRNFIQSLYPKKHPLHSFPTQKSLQAIRRQDVIDFKAKYYRPDTMVLALVGDFDPQQVRSLIETEFSKWKVKGQASTLEYPKVSTPNKLVRVSSVLPGKVQAITYMGNQGINRKDPRFYATLVLNQILGGDTLSSRLGTEIRDRQGLTYGIYSTFQTGKNAGTFLIEMQTAPEDASRAINSTRNLLAAIHQQGVTKEEVETAKRTLISNHNVSLANPEDLSYRIMRNEAYGLEPDELRSFAGKISLVSLEQVNQAARELIHPDQLAVVTAGAAVVAETKY